MNCDNLDILFYTIHIPKCQFIIYLIQSILFDNALQLRYEVIRKVFWHLFGLIQNVKVKRCPNQTNQIIQSIG